MENKHENDIVDIKSIISLLLTIASIAMFLLLLVYYFQGILFNKRGLYVGPEDLILIDSLPVFIIPTSIIALILSIIEVKKSENKNIWALTKVFVNLILLIGLELIFIMK